jgi:uncharacterized protein DUF3310
MSSPETDHIRSTGPGSTDVTGSVHYKKLKIEPIEYIEENNLPFHEGEIVKYITRWRDKGGIKDLEKVEWYVHRLMEREQKKLNPNIMLKADMSEEELNAFRKHGMRGREDPGHRPR